MDHTQQRKWVNECFCKIDELVNVFAMTRICFFSSSDVNNGVSGEWDIYKWGRSGEPDQSSQKQEGDRRRPPMADRDAFAVVDGNARGGARRPRTATGCWIATCLLRRRGLVTRLPFTSSVVDVVGCFSWRRLGGRWWLAVDWWRRNGNCNNLNLVMRSGTVIVCIWFKSWPGHVIWLVLVISEYKF